MRKKRTIKLIPIRFADVVPAFAGLVGKAALVSSFAAVWASELAIDYKHFVFDNARLELLISGVITVIAAALFANVSPPGTLAPLTVLVPMMAVWGVHPFYFSVLLGVIGIVLSLTGLFEKLVALSGPLVKVSITLAFGLSGVLMAGQKLYAFFAGETAALLLLAGVLCITYILACLADKKWLMIPAAALISLGVCALFGIRPVLSVPTDTLFLLPSQRWGTLWGIGLSADAVTVLKSLLFAVFASVLWSVDTVSVLAVSDAARKKTGSGVDMDIRKSFLIVSVRNLIGGIFGGAQTASIWRSYLIPLFEVNRGLRTSSLLMGSMALICALWGAPLALLTFPPVIWTVLLFGIFMPFLNTAVSAMREDKQRAASAAAIVFALAGVLTTPIVTWVAAFVSERVYRGIRKVKKREHRQA